MDALQPTSVQPVATDTPCIRCGYSLRGLPSNSNCPECATPVERSLLGDLLLYSDPGYVRKLRSGATMVMTSILLMVGMVIAAMVIGVITAATGAMSVILLLGGVGLVILGAAILYLIGWWTLATPDRDQLSENKGERPRTYVRYAVLGTALMKLLSIIVGFSGAVPPELRLLITLIDNFVMSVGLIAGLVYVRWLAERLPNPKIYKRARSLIILTSILVGIGVLYAAARYSGLLAALGSGVAAVVGFGALAMGITALVCTIMYYNLFSWLRKHLTDIYQAQQGLRT